MRDGLREYCFFVRRVMLWTVCYPSGIGEVPYKFGDVFVQFPGDYIF